MAETTGRFVGYLRRGLEKSITAVHTTATAAQENNNSHMFQLLAEAGSR